MSEEIAVVENGGLVLPQEDGALEEAVNGMTGSSDFRRIQLCGSNNKTVKQGKFPMGHFAIVDNDEFTDIGEEFDALVLGYRLKAMEYGDEMNIVYDFTSDEFKRIQSEAGVKDSKCMFGPEFLLWIPEYGFLPYYLNNKSSQFIASSLKSHKGKIVTIKVIFIEGKEFSWHAPKVVDCVMPFDNFPTQEEVDSALNAFNNPETVELEHAEAADGVER